MNIPAEYKAIRPYEPEEMAAAFESLFADAEFCAIVQQLYPGVPVGTLKAQLLTCTSTLDFQKKFIYRLATGILSKCCDAYDMDATAIADRAGSYTFISNHRDIVLDAAILNLLLLENGFRTTVEIAIGDNLLARPWIETVVKLNKSFIVRRGLGVREMLAASKLMSGYMHFAVGEKHENIWIAQREGRAKDSNDRTQESLLKMMALDGTGTPAERLRALHIVPLAISYEYDACDFLKAKEFQQKRDNADFKKSKADDVLNMKTGIFGYKGRVHYCAAPCIDTWLTTHADLPKAELFATTAAHIDREIHRRYRLFPNNYAAADLLSGTATHAGAGRYTPEEKARFERYLTGQLAKIDLPNKDEDYLRERLLTMYAYPVINQEAAAAAAP